MKKQMQIFDARQVVKGQLENLGTNSTTIKTDLSQTGCKGADWAEVAHSVYSKCVSCCFAHNAGRPYCLFIADKNLRLHSPDITLNITRSSFALYFVN